MTAAFDLLPEHMRASDAEGALEGFLAGYDDQVAEVLAIAERITAGDLADAEAADVVWLPWLAQLTGVHPETLPATAQLRAAIGEARYDAGTEGNLARLVARYLVEDGRFLISEHHGGDPWVIGVVVHPDDLGLTIWQALEADHPTWADIDVTGSWDAFVAEDIPIVDRPELQAVKPAGFVFVQEVATPGTWTAIEAAYPTWLDIKAAGSWQQIEIGGI